MDRKANERALKSRRKRRTGFMNGQIEVPNDFDRLYADEILALFEGDGASTVAEAEVPGEGDTE